MKKTTGVTVLAIFVLLVACLDHSEFDAMSRAAINAAAQGDSVLVAELSDSPDVWAQLSTRGAAHPELWSAVAEGMVRRKGTREGDRRAYFYTYEDGGREVKVSLMFVRKAGGWSIDAVQFDHP